ncbi:MAG: alcohol dehydrogenase [Lasallia pustulata]|uniref:Alcohol dehydrogenase n=1 Tax=Lasallia pustulata TaxID=136370 RepID=A0A5M8PIK5_9LECA|nr:MAG: alcohol dehydrogenase [Lasallia pustulata]
MAPNLPKSFKAARFMEKDAPLTVEEVDLKQPGEGEVLIKVHAVGVCHSDAMVPTGVFGTPLPRTPGHETIGDVVAVGPGERNWKVGDRVGGGWHGGHDGVCKPCKRGLNQMCVNEKINGLHLDGGYAEYCILNTEAVVRVPSDADPAAYAPLLCAGVTVFNAIRNMNVMTGGTVAIQGLGGLGHLAIQYAARMGYRVIALSSSASKEKFAKDLGASDYVDGSKEDHSEALQKLGGAALIVVTAPDPALVSNLIYGLGVLGKLLILAPVGKVEVDTVAMIGKGLSIHGWPSGQALDSEEAIEFAEIHNINCMVEKFPLNEAPKAYEHMMSGKARFRSVIVME